MKTVNIAVRVGIFVIIALALLAALVLQFGRIKERFENYYHVQVNFRHLTQIGIGASVTMSGVAIGKVGAIHLAPDGRHVSVRLDIVPWRSFRKDARVLLRQAGLLGDMYIEIVPVSDTAPLAQNGDTLTGEDPPPDLGELISEGALVLRKLHTAVTSVESVARTLDEKIITSNTAAQVRESLANIHSITTNMTAATAALNDTVRDSKPRVETTLATVEQAATNLLAVVRRADQLLQNADKLVAENREEIRAAIRNIDDSAAKVSAIISRLQNGDGTLGKLLTDPTLHDELTRLIANWRRFGILYKEGAKGTFTRGPREYIYGAAPPENTQPKQTP
ncbi:MAG: MlaD family protein [Verrucomicrobiae bacterium]|nr:MlaD family protein [Verrucomicrobiae bacterium]